MPLTCGGNFGYFVRSYDAFHAARAGKDNVLLPGLPQDIPIAHHRQPSFCKVCSYLIAEPEQQVARVPLGPSRRSKVRKFEEEVEIT